MDISGAEEIAAALRDLPAAVEQNIQDEALMIGATILADDARGRIHNHDGKLAATVRARSLKPKYPHTARAQVIAGDRQVFWASFVEYGHFLGSRKLGNKRKFVSPHPFMRPAYDARGGEAVDAITRAVETTVRNLWAVSTS